METGRARVDHHGRLGSPPAVAGGPPRTMRAPTHPRGPRARPATRLPRALLALALLVGASLVGVAGAPSAGASPPSFEAPFRCGETWYGGTRDGSHGYAIDFNSPYPDHIEKTLHVLSSGAGTVTVANGTDSWGGGYGYWVEVDHGGGWRTRYAHLDQPPLVSAGQRVVAGTHLGFTGTTGNSFGVHLHYEQRLWDVKQPPTFRGVPFDLRNQSGSYMGEAITSTNGCGPVPVPDPCGSFWDTSATNPFCDEILWAAANGVTTGYADGTFRPTEPVSRQALAAFLFRAQRAEPSYPPTYLDVDASHAFADEIGWLQVAGIATGYPDGTFRPTAPITRQAMASFLWKVAGQPTAPPAAFTDVPAGHPFAAAIAWLSSTGVSTGWPDGTFRPGEPLSRQAMVAFLQRYAGG